MGKTHDIDNDEDGDDDVADGDVDNDDDGDDDVADLDNDDEECCQDGTPSVGVTLIFLAVEFEENDDDDHEVENDDVAEGDVDKDDDDWCQGGAALARLERGGGGEHTIPYSVHNGVVLVAGVL